MKKLITLLISTLLIATSCADSKTFQVKNENGNTVEITVLKHKDIDFKDKLNE